MGKLDIWYIMLILRNLLQEIQVIFDIFANTGIGSVWSLVFFVQLMPAIGIYVMATLHMVQSSWYLFCH